MVTRPSVMAAEHLFCVPQPKPLLKPVPVASGAYLFEPRGVRDTTPPPARPVPTAAEKASEWSAYRRALQDSKPVRTYMRPTVPRKAKVCAECHGEFVPTSGALKHCPECRDSDAVIAKMPPATRSRALRRRASALRLDVEGM